MSNRYDIVDGNRAFYVDKGLVYTEVLGWVDLGHARGTDIKKILAQMDAGESSGQEYYVVTYSQSMDDPYQIVRMGKIYQVANQTRQIPPRTAKHRTCNDDDTGP